jgi:ribosome-interacting GTPase 1
MPTNVSPEYKKAEADFKKARDPAERLRCLKEMLATIPKHKGTEHLQADIKTRIKQLTEELSGPQKGAARTGPTHVIRPEGAAQIALVGPPNAGKSTLHVRLTGSQSEVAPYPFTTHSPLPGMLQVEDMALQLVDLPPITAEHMESWYVNALQPADAALLVVDLSDPECMDHVLGIRTRLDEKRITLAELWPFSPFAQGAPDLEAGPAMRRERGGGTSEDSRADGDELDDPFRQMLPALLIANKQDLDPDPDEVRVLEELLDVSYPALAVSASTGAGLDRIGPALVRGLGIVRVYTKAPGHAFEKDRPFTVRQGETIRDVARLVHRDLAHGVKFAKVWGRSVFDGQQVGPDHPVEDGDIVELHS